MHWNANKKEEYALAASKLDEISLDEFLDDIGFAYSSGSCSSKLKELIRSTMHQSLESVGMDCQSFRDWYDDIQMKAAIQNIRLASRANDDLERDWKLNEADKNLHVMFGLKAKQKAEMMQSRVRSFRHQNGISLFKEARQNFPRL